jgi:hypothetical protein
VRSALLAPLVPVPAAGPHAPLFQLWLHMAFAPPNGIWVLPRTDVDVAHVPANAFALGSNLAVHVHTAAVA